MKYLQGHVSAGMHSFLAFEPDNPFSVVKHMMLNRLNVYFMVLVHYLIEKYL
jgi:hypothetical protein